MDTNRKLRGVLKKPEWRLATMTMVQVTPAGIGARTPLFTAPMPNVGWIAVDISLLDYAPGDDALIELTKMFGVAPSSQACGLIEIANGNIIRVVGSPFFQDTAAPTPAIQNPVISFIYYADVISQLQGYVTQTVGVLKAVEAGYNYQTELITTV